MMLKYGIIDDEPLAREILSGHLRRLAPSAPVVSFSGAFEAINFLGANDVDVLLLDIEMPEMTGIELLKTLARPPLTIFTTAYRNYAFEGFELGVIDFLLKPISFERFNLAMERVHDFLALRDPQASLEKPDEPEAPAFVFVKSGLQRIKLEFDTVSHIQGLKDYAIIHSTTGKIILKGSIKAMCELFPSRDFIRVHKSFMVSKNKINRLERDRILIGSHQIPIGRNYREEVLRLMGRG